MGKFGFEVLGALRNKMDNLKEFYGPNAGYVLELYERYLADPGSVDPHTRQYFDSWTPTSEAASPVEAPSIAGFGAEIITAAVNLANAIRTYGHLSAHLDPLGSPPPGDPWHEPAYHGISDAELRQLPAAIIGGSAAKGSTSAFEAIQELRKIYTSTVGYDYGHIQEPEERDWLRQVAESGQFRPPQDPVDERALLERLTQVETFEQFLHRIFPGKTRFSIEGLDMMVPMLDELLNSAAGADICSVLIGMAHRGRLNILTHVLGQPYAQILAEFKDPIGHFPTREQLGWTGDVKYHKGAYRAVKGGGEIKLVISMAPNPSHLEHINPVILGMARSAGSKVDQPGKPTFFPDASLAILIHGDASIIGQGVVAESLNISRLPGYSIGGSVHIIANNQLGYTTEPGESRSTLYASDLAKGFEIPIIHVNADDPIGCLEAVRTAFAYRLKFRKDFMVDLIGYRRFGHNEGDEPTFTQPNLYDMIDKHPTLRQIRSERLVQEGIVKSGEPEELVRKQMGELQEILARLEPEEEMERPQISPPPRGAARQVETAYPLDMLVELNQALLQLPDGFALHRKLERARKRRRNVLDDPDQATIDWATAEELAFASILSDGVAIRMSGEDVARGTFSQRHAVFYSTSDRSAYTPLQNIPQSKAAFEIVNSPLSENAALAFEYGYNILSPVRLVVWEAQYGDFINTAQAIIDELIVSARAKWELTPSLVLLLPHGIEGQGPDHSSGRPERFLQMAADTNLRLANCTSAAQYFHLLRRQAALLETDPLPLIVMTPKSLLRHPLVASTPRQLAEGRWQPVIADARAIEKPHMISRLILCSGKIYIDLISDESWNQHPEVAILRVEQLYPFPVEDIAPLLGEFSNLEEIVWVQEEPQNMGAWTFAAPLLRELIAGRWPLHYVGRAANASPAEGSSAYHAKRQKAIVEKALAQELARVTEG